MSSSILFKMRYGQNFESVTLPGSAARLIDVKKAIITAKNLDKGGNFDFDLKIEDATTQQHYADDAMILPRGTRIIVKREPTARGHGIVVKLQRMAAGMGTFSAVAQPSSVPNDFYTVQSAGRDEEEFVSSKKQSDKELEALRAATAITGPTAPGGSMMRSSHTPGGGGRGGFGGGGGGNRPPGMPPSNRRPNADPELRNQETAVKKRATGIPRTFLPLESESDAVLQPNAAGLEDLKNRGGGQSENAAGSRRDFEYALSLTATTLPDYIQCAICLKILKDAMMIPWDDEGRNTCERCIRDALTQSGCTCPLTGLEAVSPDDLLPNQALRKAAAKFSEKVWKEAQEIEEQRVDDEEDVPVAADGKDDSTKLVDTDEKGVLVSKRLEQRKKKGDSDMFEAGDDDDFGGDVFAVEAPPEKEEEQTNTQEAKPIEPVKQPKPTQDTPSPRKTNTAPQPAPMPENSEESPAHSKSQSQQSPPLSDSKPTVEADPVKNRRDRRRGPPVGYSMGAAGGMAGPRDEPRDRNRSHRGKRHEERGRDDWGRDDSNHRVRHEDDRGGTNKRPRSNSDTGEDLRRDDFRRHGDHDGGRDTDRDDYRRRDHEGGRGFRGGGFRGGGRGGYRGRWDGGGRGFRGRGGYRGRGRY